MRLRTFTARSMPDALRQIKEEMGEDAIILSSKELGRGIQVTAAIEPEGAAAVPPRREDKESQTADQLKYNVQACLRFHNIPELYIAKMMTTLTEATVAHILARGRMNIADESKYFLQLALEHICTNFFQFHKKAHYAERILLVGAPGIGKTLTIAKRATEYALENVTPTVITTDVMRAGGIEQLQSFTDILGIDLIVCKNVRELARELKQVNKATPVLIDTAGCNPYDETEVDELAAMANLPGVEPVMVIPAGMDSQEAIDIAEIFMTMPISKIIATRTDSTRRFGGLISVACAHRLALYMMSSSASVTDALRPCIPKTLTECLMAYMAKPPSLSSMPKQLQSV